LTPGLGEAAYLREMQETIRPEDDYIFGVHRTAPRRGL
jgi:hypothetical protein